MGQTAGRSGGEEENIQKGREKTHFAANCSCLVEGWGDRVEGRVEGWWRDHGGRYFIWCFRRLDPNPDGERHTDIGSLLSLSPRLLLIDWRGRGSGWSGVISPQTAIRIVLEVVY